MGYTVIDWHAQTINNKDIDFVILHKNKRIYCEVNSPSWLKDIEKDKRSIRKKKPKYINGEVITTDSAAPRCEISNQFLKILINLKDLFAII